MSEKIEVGSIVEGKVLRVKPFGAIVSIGENTQGLVHISQITDRYIKHPREVLKVGDVVRVKVISVDAKKKRIGLSMKGIPQK